MTDANKVAGGRARAAKLSAERRSEIARLGAAKRWRPWGSKPEPEKHPTPSMDDKATPSPPERQVWQYEADKLLGVNARPWPSDEARRAALVAAGLGHWIPDQSAPATAARARR